MSSGDDIRAGAGGASSLDVEAREVSVALMGRLREECEVALRAARDLSAERDRLEAEVKRLRLCANSARVLIERYLARSPGGKLLRTALRELDDAMHGEQEPHDEELAQ